MNRWIRSLIFFLLGSGVGLGPLGLGGASPLAASEDRVISTTAHDHSGEGKVWLWDFGSRQSIAKSQPHLSGIYHLRLTSDGKTMLQPFFLAFSNKPGASSAPFLSKSDLPMGMSKHVFKNV